jgi:asparagine synthase (glutamine-hydrolysing)
MSGIFGFAYLDGQPASPEHFQKMADEMAGWGPDGVGRIISGNAAFGHALLIVTHESRFEKMPIHDRDMGILFTAAARLDNRDELCDFFSIPHPERPTTSDGQLVLKAYKKWGTDSCKHIFGDWSFAAWHIKEQRLFLARDHLGNTGLYYYFKPPLIVFASNTEAILSHPKVPRELDELQLAKRLGFNIEENDWARTYWKGVSSLYAAHSLNLAESYIQINNYWQFNEAPPVRLGSDSAYIEGFLDHFRRAVRVRLNSIRPIGSMLSAGLDSSSVTVLAAEALREDNRHLTAFTSVPLHPVENLFPGAITNEWQLSHKVAERYNNIEHIPIQAEDITPLDSIRRNLNIVHVPQHAVTNKFWLIAIFENARRHNLGVMLTGQLGNGGISWSGGRDYIFHLFASKQVRKALFALNAWKKQKGCSWYSTLKHHILRPILLSFWPEYNSFLHRNPRPFYAFPQKDFIKRLGLNENSAILYPGRPLNPLAERMLTTIRNGINVGPIQHVFGTFYNMETRDPTSDIRLLEFCMGIPDEQHTHAGGERMLIRRAMAGRLPDSVRWNTHRGKQAADILVRLTNQEKILEKEFTRFESIPEVNKYLDIAAMKQAWVALRTDQSITTANANAIMRTLNAAYFLLDLSGHNRDIL